MKTRPILFSGPMVLAILDNRKTQTRRIVKPQPREYEGGTSFVCHGDAAWSVIGLDGDHQPIRFPYGNTGDRLWVRETFNLCGFKPFYRADGPMHKDWKWKSPIFMPRAASRITLEIISVRVEKLGSITPADAVAEGMAIDDAVHDYAVLWDKINGAGSWEANPFIWRIEFKKVPNHENTH